MWEGALVPRPLSADRNGWQGSNVFFLLMLTLLIVIEITTTAVKVFEHERKHEHPAFA